MERVILFDLFRASSKVALVASQCVNVVYKAALHVLRSSAQSILMMILQFGPITASYYRLPWLENDFGDISQQR